MVSGAPPGCGLVTAVKVQGLGFRAWAIGETALVEVELHEPAGA